MNSDFKILEKAESFLCEQKIKYKKPAVITQLSRNRVEVIFKHHLYDDPDYIICPDEYRVIVNLDTDTVEWGFQM